MLSSEEARQIFDNAEQIYSAAAVSETVQKMAVDITETLSEQCPLVLSVMGGAVVFTGQLLPLLEFPLNFDYLHVSRYNDKLKGGRVNWKVEPHTNVKDRVVLVLDDILDEGITLLNIKDELKLMGARSIVTVVLFDKKINIKKSTRADFVGLAVPNKYVYGFGLDFKDRGRNLPNLYSFNEK